MIMKRIILASAIAVALMGNSARAEADLTVTLDSLLADATLDNALFGIAIYDITADSMLYGHDPDKLFSPASNMKLFTSAAALELLGPDYRFETSFLTNGKLDSKGRLKGDLVMVGGGDPLISGRFRDSVTEILELWADSLISLGVKEIKGDIVIDNSFFSGPVFGAGWSWDDMTYWYACPISALSFNDNCVDLKFLPGEKAGDPAIIEIDPLTDYMSISNNAVTLPSDSEFTLDYYRIPYTNNVTFFGGISVSDSSGEIDYVSVHRPEIYTAYILTDILYEREIKFDGEILSLDDMEDERQGDYADENFESLFNWQSDSLGVVISVINKNSQNFFAEQTLKTIGRELGGEGSFARGIDLCEAFFDSIGISLKDIQMYDGSGLSYINLVKPLAVIELLKAMRNSRSFKTYYESLAIPGQDRSVRTRLEGVENRGRVRSKTGHIANTSTFSGYIDGPHSGHLIAFSLMVNNYSCDTDYVISWHDSVVSFLLSRF
jgi:D-alanyl-D-alanine carboxypeptidase/D-alanyl-D-alanine-endopeptidase (penicillin-binding protein 4)